MVKEMRPSGRRDSETVRNAASVDDHGPAGDEAD
jgi:hypothetical protein